MLMTRHHRRGRAAIDRLRTVGLRKRPSRPLVAVAAIAVQGTRTCVVPIPVEGLTADDGKEGLGLRRRGGLVDVAVAALRTTWQTLSAVAADGSFRR